MSDRRRFNDRERAALWVAAGGACVLCGAALMQGWHADHIKAFVHGGMTDVVNGQALCVSCNLCKGAGAMDDGEGAAGWPSSKPLRNWQVRAFGAFRESDAADFLCVATPGGGKTAFALLVARYLFEHGEIGRVVVVVPTEHLRVQWHAAAHECGVQLNPTWRNSFGRETSDFDGIVVTYQSVASAPLVYRTQCGQRPTLVILDEIHHAGDSLSWGDNIRQAFETAERRLLLSGTPFRNDGRAIPFVRYESGATGSVCRADFSYGYADAITDKVCRPVMFPRFDGQMQWWGRAGLRTATFRDELSEEEASQRLKTALDVRQNWLPDVLREADAQLREIRRETQPDAGGLVVCIDQPHAKGIADLLATITGEEPAIAISEDAQASDRIKLFSGGSTRWIVAVKMISEGVDIPRLRVGVYATNVISELFFRQVVGRFVRKQYALEEQVAYLFIPDEETLKGYAEQIKDEREYALTEIMQEIRQQADRDPDAGPALPRLFVPVSAEDEAAGVIFGDIRIDRSEWDRAADVARQVGKDDRDSILLTAQILRVALDTHGVEPSAALDSGGPSHSVHGRRTALRDVRKVKITRFAGTLASLTTQPRSDVFSLVNRRLARVSGSYVEQATLTQLTLQVELLDAWSTGLYEAYETGTSLAWATAWEAGEYDADPTGATASA